MKNNNFDTNSARVQSCNFAEHDMQLLLAQLELELVEIYPDMPKPSMLHPLLALMVTVDDEPLGCVALVPVSERIAEIKRLFIVPSARGLGLAKKLLTYLEQQAKQLGLKQILVETGYLQPAAISLYQRLDYQPIAPYGPYIGNLVSRCFEKRLSTT